MRSHYSQQSSLVYRVFLVSALAIAAIVTFAEIARSFFSAGTVFANAGTVPAGNSLSTYRWNLKNAGLPLLSLPNRISGVDLSLTYSMDQFQFPLFQSLYYNQRARKYILMVLPKNGGRAEFIELMPVNGRRQFEAKRHSRLRLEDKGKAKLLTTGEGTVYTFTAFNNGEYHCSQIRNADGSVISLRYTDSALIETIVDVSGRTVSFGYEKDYVTSITQTWGQGSAKMQTWAVAGNSSRARKTNSSRAVSPTFNRVSAINSSRVRPAVELIPARVTSGKRLPKNAVTTAYTPAMAASDSRLASIFGGRGAVAAAHGFEPVALPRQYPLYRGDLILDNGRLSRGHLSYAMHLYGSSNGTDDTELYVPAGFTSHSTTPTPTDAAITFYYPRLGNLNNVTLAVFHVANFRLSHEGTRVRIGSTGGRGGSIYCYRHAHLEFYRGDTGLPSSASRPRLRIDPASVFAAPSHVASRSGSHTRSSY